MRADDDQRPPSEPDAAVSIESLPGFSVADFAKRWASARRAACLSFAESAREDADALEAVPLDRRDDLLRAVFDNSRRLGESAVRRFGVAWELEDFPALLPSLGVPCFQFEAGPRASAYVIERPGCPEHRAGAGFVCDYWREALDGLVMGVGIDVFLARHSSRGNGGPRCLDVLYAEGRTRSRHAERAADRLAPASETVVALMASMARGTLSAQLEVQVEGMSEDVVHYRLVGSAEDVASPAAARLHQTIAARLATLEPPLRALDVTPRPVFVEAP